MKIFMFMAYPIIMSDLGGRFTLVVCVSTTKASENNLNT